MKEWVISESDLGCDGAYLSYNEVVRCGECKFYDNDFGYCVEWQREKPRDWFCADGRKGEEDETNRR